MSGLSAAVADRPRPQITALTEGFWSAAREHRLVRPVCRVCATNFFTPQICCPACLSEDWSYETSSGRGAIYSSTVVHRAPVPGFEPPYHVAIVDLQENWSMLCNVIAPTAAPVPIGTPVEVTWVDVDASLSLPAFRPVEVVA